MQSLGAPGQHWPSARQSIAFGRCCTCPTVHFWVSYYYKRSLLFSCNRVIDRSSTPSLASQLASSVWSSRSQLGLLENERVIPHPPPVFRWNSWRTNERKTTKLSSLIRYTATLTTEWNSRNRVERGKITFKILPGTGWKGGKQPLKFCQEQGGKGENNL